MTHYNYKNKKYTYQQGQVMLITVILFLVVSLTIVLGIATPILKQVKASLDAMHSVESYYLAQGSMEDALYRIKSNKTLVSGDTVTINGYTSTITLASGTNYKTIDVSANRGGVVRKMEAQVTTGIGASFNYGIQSGTGGFNISGGSTVNGNVYSNGSILGSSATITGSAIAANSGSLTSDQSNIGTTPISTCTSSTCITFRDTSSTQDFGQSFMVSTSSPIHDIKFYIKKVGSPSDITVHLVADKAGIPSTTDLFTSTQTLSASNITTTFGWVDYTFTSNPILDPTQTYWIVLDSGSQSTSNYYQIGATSGGYANGVAKIGKYTGTWNATSPSGLDSYFNLYLGGLTSTIGGGAYVGSINIGTSGVGDAWAHTVKGASVAGSLYCQTGSNNSAACNTSKPDPSATGYPLSDANIQAFKDEATTTGSGWTYTGNLTIGSTGTTTTTLQHVTGNLTINGGGTATLSDIQVDGDVLITGGGILKAGPMRINGNLDDGSSMTMLGTVYVLGTITVGSGGSVSLDSSYGSASGVLVTDGTVTIQGGGHFYGSGTTGSFPMLVTTSDCPNGSGCGGVNAIAFSGGAGAVVLNAQNGAIYMSGGTGAESLTANLITITGGGTVTYNSGLANLNFSSGPSGGWNISGWKEVQ